MRPEPNSGEAPPGLRPPRFGLRTLMWSITLIAIFLGLFVYLGSHITAGLVLLALAIFAHVAGNALGTRLRASGGKLGAKPSGGAPASNKARDSDFAPPTRLRHRSSLGRPIIFITIVGFLMGGAFGAFVFVLLMNVLTPTNVALGILAAAILGGIWTFIAASFVQVAAGAVWQAMRETKRR